MRRWWMWCLLIAVLLSGACSKISCNRPNPPDPPTPPPPTPGPIALDMLLHQQDAKLYRGAEQIHAFMAIQCCMPAPDAVGNSRWPMFSESWVDYTKAYGVNFYHARLGPFYGDANHESEWTDVGGPYVGGPGSDWNPAFWEKVRALVAYALQNKAWVEVNTIDTWYCKHAQWGDQEMPWPDEDIQGCGRRGTPGQERWLRKVVSELGQYGNVIWLLDNEGGEIDGAQVSWWLWAHDIIRDEEMKTGFNVVHMIGTNNPDFGDVGDYVATHSKQALLQPLSGRWTINNERNPAGVPELEAANFAKARELGLAWAFWRAEMSEAAMTETLSRMRDIAGGGGGPVGCFPPDAEDPSWKLVSPKPACAMCAVVDQAKDKMGNPCGRNPVESGESFASVLRGMGYCAGFYKDQVSILRPDGDWEEHHVIAWTDGCYTQTQNGFKNVWHYGGAGPGPTPSPTTGPTVPPPSGECPDPQPPDPNRVNVEPHNLLYDATAKTCDKAYCQSIGSDQQCCPARLEGDPNRQVCEATWGTPRWDGDGTIQLTDNPYQARCKDCTWVQVCVKNACGRYEK